MLYKIPSNRVMLRVSPWKGVVCFGKRGKLNPRYVRPFKVLEKVRAVTYKLELPQELSRVYNMFHVSNLKKCYADEPLAVPLDGLHIDDKLHLFEEPIEIMDHEVKRLKRSRILIFKCDDSAPSRGNTTLRTLPKSRMTKQGNFTQRTPQAKKQSDQASRQISKQASSANAPLIIVVKAMAPPLGQPRQPHNLHPSPNWCQGRIPPSRHPHPFETRVPTSLIGWAASRAMSSARLGQRRSPIVKVLQVPDSSDSQAAKRRESKLVLRTDLLRHPRTHESGHGNQEEIYCEDEDEDMSRPWRRQKVDAFTRRISDFSEDKKRRMPATLKSSDRQLRRAFRLNFTQRKKCAKNPVELARVKQRQGESTSAYVERYKDECIHVKACPEILKISGFMNGINNPELIKRLNDRVPQTFDELMKRTRSFIQGEAAAADSRKGYSNNRSQEQSRRQSNDQSSSRNNSYRGQRGGRGNDKYTPLTMTPKEILATEGANFPRPPPMRTPEEQRVGNGYYLDHLVKERIKEGKDKQGAVA
ncbi:hypothetical protein Tco_0735704 [Tanacetum coccineum]